MHKLLYNQFLAHIKSNKDNSSELKKIDQTLEENKLNYTSSTLPANYTAIPSNEDKKNMNNVITEVLLAELKVGLLGEGLILTEELAWGLGADLDK